jgi:AraC-like DNA-binding protein
VPSETATRIEGFIDYCDIRDSPDQALFFGEWLYYESASGERVRNVKGNIQDAARRGEGYTRRPRPEPMDTAAVNAMIKRRFAAVMGGAPTSTHRLRRTASQLAEAAARDYLAAMPNGETAHVTAQDIRAMLLEHTLSRDLRALYADLRDTDVREMWSAVATAGIHDFIRGARGARLGLDVSRIVDARRLYQEAQAELLAAEEEIADVSQLAESVKRGLHPIHDELRVLRPRKAKLLDRQGISGGDFRKLFLELASLDLEIEEAEGRLAFEAAVLAARLDAARSHATDATSRLHRAETSLEQAVQARVPLAEDAPDPDIQAELQTLLHGLIASDEETDVNDDEPVLSRRHLSVKEYAEVMGLSHSTLRRYIADTLRSGRGYPWPQGDRRNPWYQPLEEIFFNPMPGSRRRFFVFDALDLSRYRPEQIRAMKALLALAR